MSVDKLLQQVQQADLLVLELEDAQQAVHLGLGVSQGLAGLVERFCL